MHPFCLNCNRPLGSSDHFCPSCGQENNAHKRGIGTLLHDFFSNYFSFDSKISRSVVPFLFQPGVLTIAYNMGKRTSFIHPLRLYIIISFFFSLFLAFIIDKLVEEEKISLIADHKSMSLSADLSPEKEEKLKANIDSANVKLGMAAAKLMNTDSAQAALPTIKAPARPAETENEYVAMFQNKELTDDQILDSLKMDKKSELDRLMIHQARKIADKDMDVFLPYLGKNLSILMFLLLPIFAFYLYALFGRTEKYYISHAIHALHLHAFSFLILSLLLLMELSVDLLTNNTEILIFAFFIITFYALFSIKKVYNQGWLKTCFKFCVLGFFYLISLTIGTLLEAAVSFAMF